MKLHSNIYTHKVQKLQLRILISSSAQNACTFLLHLTFRLATCSNANQVLLLVEVGSTASFTSDIKRIRGCYWRTREAIHEKISSNNWTRFNSQCKLRMELFLFPFCLFSLSWGAPWYQKSSCKPPLFCFIDYFNEEITCSWPVHFLCVVFLNLSNISITPCFLQIAVLW